MGSYSSSSKISWDDVDLDGARVVVRWQITGKSYRAAERRGEHGQYRTKPKTRAGEDRVVDLDMLSVKVLKVWRTKQAAERMKWGCGYLDPADVDGASYNLVFAREDGSPLDPDQTYKTFVRLVANADLPHLKVHGLRHINISLQLDAGVLRDGHRDAGGPHLTHTDPINLRTPDRHSGAAGCRGDRRAGAPQAQGAHPPDG